MRYDRLKVSVQVGCHSRPGSVSGVNSSGNPVSFPPKADPPLAEKIGKERHWIPAHAHSAERQAECVSAGMTSFKKGAPERLRLEKLTTMLIYIGCIFCLFALPGKGSTAFAVTYSDFMKRATTEEKPAQLKTEEENPVLVDYEVGDTSHFYTEKGKTPIFEEESEWEEWEGEGE